MRGLVQPHKEHTFDDHGVAAPPMLPESKTDFRIRHWDDEK